LCTEIAHYNVPKLSSQYADVPKTTSTVPKTTGAKILPPYVPKWTCTELDRTRVTVHVWLHDWVPAHHACSECPLLQVLKNALVVCVPKTWPYDRKTARMTAQPRCCRRECMYDCAQARPRMQWMSVIASFQKYPRRGSVRVRTPLRGSVESGVRVSDSFHIFSCAVIHAVALSGFRELWTFRSQDHSLPPAKVPGVELSLPGSFVPTNKEWKFQHIQKISKNRVVSTCYTIYDH